MKQQTLEEKSTQKNLCPRQSMKSIQEKIFDFIIGNIDYNIVLDNNVF